MQPAHPDSLEAAVAWLREQIEADRNLYHADLLDECLRARDYDHWSAGMLADFVIRHMMVSYADRPGYRASWGPR